MDPLIVVVATLLVIGVGIVAFGLAWQRLDPKGRVFGLASIGSGLLGLNTLVAGAICALSDTLGGECDGAVIWLTLAGIPLLYLVAYAAARREQDESPLFGGPALFFGLVVFASCGVTPWLILGS